MATKSAFDTFAPSILKIYYKDKESFWAAVLAPFLENNVSLTDWWKYLKIDMALLSSFRGLDREAQKTLRDFGSPRGVDITKWRSNRIQYFKDAYPIFAFLVVWMDENGLQELIGQFGEILRTGVYAVAGYGILDENVDNSTPSPVEILVAQALIAEYEHRALSVFGVTKSNLDIIHKMRTLFLNAEIMEKSVRGISSPYRLDEPEHLGSKGANAVTPFMLSLERLGKTSLVDKYWEVFLLFGAAIQMMDDWEDLEKDLEAGHYSYITIGYEKLILEKSPYEAARMLRANEDHVLSTYIRSMEMIEKSKNILERLDDKYLLRLVEITELRVNGYFAKILKKSVLQLNTSLQVSRHPELGRGKLED